MRRIATQGAGLAVFGVLFWATPALADFTATHSAGVGGGDGSVTMVGDSDGDFLDIRLAPTGDKLAHNRLGLGDANFASQFDFDTTHAGEQILSNSALSSLAINAGAGSDQFHPFADSALVPNVTFVGGADGDLVQTHNESSNPQTITLNGGLIDGIFGGHLTHAESEVAIIATSSADADDTVTVASSPSVPTEISTGPGDDSFTLANNTNLGNQVFAGPGTDTLNYSAWSAPVTTDLAQAAAFEATLTGDQQNPPVVTAATGSGLVTFPDMSSNQFNYSIDVTGLTAAQITDSHIHAGAPGVNGNIIFPIGAGSTWSQPATPRTFVPGNNDPDITEPSLRDGNTYFNIHTTAHPNGEIRGRIQVSPEFGYSGAATGFGANGAFMVENVIGGSGNDTLTANPLVNRLEGRGGNDTLNAVDGEADALLDCGAGTNDVLNRDPGGLDADGVVSDCETVNPPLAPALSRTDPASGANDNTPLIKGSGPAGSTIDLYANNNCSGNPAVNDAPVASLAGAGIEAGVADNSTTQFSATATTGGSSACSNSLSYTEVTPAPGGGGGDGSGGSDGDGAVVPTPTVDTKAPETSVRNAKVKGEKVILRFGSDETGSSFKCKLDKKGFKPCVSPKTYKNLDEGKHKFLVIATDPAGNSDPSAAKTKFEIEE